jgi:hypothetical protein
MDIFVEVRTSGADHMLKIFRNGGPSFDDLLTDPVDYERACEIDRLVRYVAI